MGSAPSRSSVSSLPLSAPTFPERITFLMRSPSMTIAAPSAGSLPVQSIRNALVSTVMGMRASFGDDPRFVHPDLLVGAWRPLDPAGHAVEVVLLPEEHPRRLVVHHLLQLGPGLEALLRVHDRHGLGDLGGDGLVASVEEWSGLPWKSCSIVSCAFSAGPEPRKNMSPVVRFLILSRCVPHSFTTTLTLMPSRWSCAAMASETSLSSG